tara:strand:+ start:2145 stop:3812 length:1668 start_codon:yes stop_codon:yes gene_type:complete
MKRKKNNLTLEDYELEFSYIESKNDINILFNRVAFVFFIFLIVALVFSLKSTYFGFLEINNKKIRIHKKDYRASIVDRNGNILAKTVNTINVGINPNLVIDKKKLLLNLKIIFPNKNFENFEKKFIKKKFFYLEKQISQEKLEQLILLGDKSIITEERISRVYPHSNLFSHIIGQIDDDNNGISGIENYFDYELRASKNPIELTVDTDLQYLIRKELIKANEIFNNKGSTAILMNVNNGEILSMVSLPDFNLNRRNEIKDVNYINRATKSVYELGSVFKTFTFAAGINEGVIQPETKFKNLEKKLRCGKFTIREYDDKIPKDLTAEQILIRSGNIGSVRIGQKVGIEKLKIFFKKIGVLDKIEFDLEEVGQPIKFNWGKCKLATVSFGHGITTTPLQLAKGYSIISNGGFNIRPTLIKNNLKNKKYKKRILNEGISKKINLVLRKIVSTKEGTGEFANVPGYEVGGKTGTAQKTVTGGYSKSKVNTFAAIFPTSNPKFVLVTLLDEPKISKDYIYKYRNKKGSFKGTPFNTAGWTSAEITGKIIERIGPILATKY